MTSPGSLTLPFCSLHIFPSRWNLLRLSTFLAELASLILKNRSFYITFCCFYAKKYNTNSCTDHNNKNLSSCHNFMHPLHYLNPPEPCLVNSIVIEHWRSPESVLWWYMTDKKLSTLCRIMTIPQWHWQKSKSTSYIKSTSYNITASYLKTTS